MANSNQAPIFIQTPLLWAVALSNQTLTRDGVTAGGGGAVLMGVASDRGALIEEVWCTPHGDFSANVARLFLRTAGSATNILVAEVNIPAQSGSTNTAAVIRTDFQLFDLLSPVGSFGLRLPPGAGLYAALGTASGVGLWVRATGGQYELV